MLYRAVSISLRSRSLLRGAVLIPQAPTRFSVVSQRFFTPVAHYHDRVIDHFENPRNVGSLDAKSEDVGTAVVGAPACGDVMKLQIRVGAGDVIEDAKFKTFGCGSAIASSSFLSEFLRGKTLDEALSVKNTDIASHLNLPPVKLHCSMLAEDAAKAAVADFKKKRELKKQE